MRLAVIIGMIMALLMFVNTSVVQASSHLHSNDGWMTLHEEAIQVRESVKNREFEKGKQILERAGTQLPSLTYEEQQLSAADMGILIRSYEQAMEAVTAVDEEYEERLQQVAAFQLAINSVIHKDSPTWKESETHVMETLDILEKNVKSEQVEEAKQAFHQFLSEFETIRPAFSIRMSKDQVERITSYVQHLEENQQDWLRDPSGEKVKQLRNEMEAIYHPGRFSNIDPSLIWVMISVGGMVFVSLSYAGWKKYRAERKRERAK